LKFLIFSVKTCCAVKPVFAVKNYHEGTSLSRSFFLHALGNDFRYIKISPFLVDKFNIQKVKGFLFIIWLSVHASILKKLFLFGRQSPKRN